MPAKKKSKPRPTVTSQLREKLAEATNRVDYLENTVRATNDLLDDKKKALVKLTAETKEDARCIYAIHELRRGGKRVGIARSNYGLDPHELLGLLEMAIEDVKLQIRSLLPPPKRVFQNQSVAPQSSMHADCDRS